MKKPYFTCLLCLITSTFFKATTQIYIDSTATGMKAGKIVFIRLLMPSLIFICFFSFSNAQQLPERVVLQVSFSTSENVRVSAARKIPLGNITPFLAYSISWEGSGEEIAIRFSIDGQRWDAWQLLHRDPHSIGQTPNKVSELGFTSRDVRYFQLQVTQGAFEQLKGHFYSPGDNPETSPQESFPADNSLECSCIKQQPAYQTRSQWCPDGSCPPNPNPSMTDVTHLIVHHSAGTNSSSDWAANVRSIWDFHVNTLGYSDIGFNWLIDPNGVIYEGRGDNIVGSVFCATNFGTMAACLLGNFDLIEPSEEARSSLVELLAWKACDRDIAPLEAAFHASTGLTLDNISGHRDGCGSDCPGDLLYAQLPFLRSQVDTFCITAVNEFFNPSTVEVFPNPAGSDIAVHIANDLFGEIRFLLFDLQGKMLRDLLTMKKSTAEQTFYLNTGSLRPGMYILQITHEQGLASFKLVKQ